MVLHADSQFPVDRETVVRDSVVPMANTSPHLGPAEGLLVVSPEGRAQIDADRARTKLAAYYAGKHANESYALHRYIESNRLDLHDTDAFENPLLDEEPAVTAVQPEMTQSPEMTREAIQQIAAMTRWITYARKVVNQFPPSHPYVSAMPHKRRFDYRLAA